jgi:hypothetical protein
MVRVTDINNNIKQFLAHVLTLKHNNLFSILGYLETRGYGSVLQIAGHRLEDRRTVVGLTAGIRGKGKKVKLALQQAMKAHMGSRGIALFFL